MAYTLSLIETAIDVTDGQIPGRDLQAVVELGKVLLDHPVQLLDGVIEGVDALTDEYRVMIITKGDLLHQESKVRSEEHTSELQSLMRISYDVFCLKKKKMKSMFISFCAHTALLFSSS